MLIPGILEVSKDEALKKLMLLNNVSPKIQLDIADGLLVHGKTFLDISFLFDLNITSQIQLHLMVQKPEAFIMLLPPVVKEVCIQAEAFMYNPLCLESYDDVLKARGIPTGLSFNPSTPYEEFEECIKHCDFVQFMAVDPGGQGRPFILDTLDKVSGFKEKYPEIKVQVDGGIAEDTINMIVEAGADDLIIGSAIFNSPEPIQAYYKFVLQSENAHRNFYHSQHRAGVSGQ